MKRLRVKSRNQKRHLRSSPPTIGMTPSISDSSVSSIKKQTTQKQKPIRKRRKDNFRGDDGFHFHFYRLQRFVTTTFRLLFIFFLLRSLRKNQRNYVGNLRLRSIDGWAELKLAFETTGVLCDLNLYIRKTIVKKAYIKKLYRVRHLKFPSV